MQHRLRRQPSAELRERLDGLVREVTLEKQAEMAAEFDRIHSVERARDVASLREILEPRVLRAKLIASLRRALDAPPASPPAGKGAEGRDGGRAPG
jgi:hypothetical protein